uniref:hypothetical protein n=1 Tax=Stenotrophomonas sp. TaxID=69392 RepID=UPI0028A192CC
MSKAKAEGQSPLAIGRSAPLLAGALVLLAIWFGYSGVRQWRQASVGQTLEASRDAVAQGLQAALTSQAAQLQKVLKS